MRCDDVLPLAACPDIVPIVARWLQAEWHHAAGLNADQTGSVLASRCQMTGVPICLVALANGLAVGTVSLVLPTDDERDFIVGCQLTSLYVVPGVRRTGVGSQLVRAAQLHAQTAGQTPVTAFTAGAGTLYQRLGWHLSQRSPLPDGTIVRGFVSTGGH